MVFREPGFPTENNKAEDPLNKEQVDEFAECIGEIEKQIALINAVGDELDKEYKLDALAAIKELKVVKDMEKKKELIANLKTAVGLINVWSGDDLDKSAKSRAQELIEKLG